MTSLSVVGNVVFAFLLVLDIVALGIRLRSRSLQGLSLCFNDYATLLILPLVTGLFIILVLGTIKGAVGQHLDDASPPEVTFLLKLKTIPIAGIIWITANTLIKASILHFYNTVFGINRAFCYTTYVVAAVVVSFGISTVLQEVLLCRPFAKYWNSHLPGVCGSSSATILAEAVINMLIDIAIIVLPLPLVWGLQMTRRRKIVFTMVVGLGSIICIITILRIVFAVQFDVHDITFAYYRVSATTVLEPVLGIIVACLPMFPSAFKRSLGGEWDEHDSGKMRLSGTTRLRSNNNGMRRLRDVAGLDDSYPLADVEIGQNRVETGLDGSDGRAERVPSAFKR